MHTTRSDGRLSVEEAAYHYRSAGFDAVAVTDHWRYFEGGSYEGLTLISGCEYNLGRHDTISGVMHILGLGMKKDPNLSREGADAPTVLEGIRAAGGLAVLAHPAWSLNTPEEVCALEGIDLVEIYNTVSGVGQSSRPYSGYFADLLANRGVFYPLIATDDAHFYRGEDECKSFVSVKAENASAEALLAGIRRGDFFASQGPELFVWREGNEIAVRCSECCSIDFLSNTSYAKDKMLRGENLREGRYTVKEWEKWVRVEVCDKMGRYAWSSAIVL